ncbi:diguanylate cyclase domain-containing protein [Deinococcus yavapaiensis]|uniref:Diguanylate cyclase n=1 Tax=Deinococcus yavapaiensis KR-236 TaxID=694435 RepID=A0A318S4P6_9DEIO|nr:diguanylate cyclase [Deinococcus yavapaiensis]PYE53057.1 diguanylate cyclase [Deinococcus yavapaiensis KR-236]
MFTLGLLALNLSLLVTLSFLGSLAFRAWPLSHDRRTRFWLSGFAAVSGVVLMLASVEGQPGVRLDLRYVPIALITLRYGLAWGAPVAAVILAARFGIGGPGATYSIYVALGVLAISVWAQPLARDLRAWRPRAWRRFSLAFLLLGALVVTGTAAGLFPGASGLHANLVMLTAYTVLVVALSVLGLALSFAVIDSRLRLLELGATYRAQAFTDALTDLPNRRAFNEALSSLPAGQSLLLLDVDHFKRVNDSFGHDVGDDVLRWIGRRLSDTVRKEDGVFRLGGEEFAVLLRTTSSEETLVVARRLVSSVRDAPNGPAHGVRVTLSGGLARRAAHERGADAYRRADEALYLAKTSGRDRLAIAARASTLTPSGVTTQEVLPGATDFSARRSLWRTVRATLSALQSERDVTLDEWAALLDGAVTSVPGADAGTLDVLDGGEFRTVAQHGLTPDVVNGRQSVGERFAWYGGSDAEWRAGSPRVLHGERVAARAANAASALADARDFEDLPDVASRTNSVQATLCLPIVVDGHVVAHLNLDSFVRFDAFGPDAHVVASEFAVQIGALLGARARRERERRRRSELEALVDVGVALGPVRTLEDAALVLTQHARALFDTTRVTYLRYDPVEDTLRSDILGGRGGKFKMPRGTGAAWAALSSGAIVRTGKAEAVLAIPLDEHGVLVAVRDASRPFTDDDERLAQALSNFAVAALSRTRGSERLSDVP